VKESGAVHPDKRIFAGTPTYNHPILLIGRKMVMGTPAISGATATTTKAARKTESQLMMAAKTGATRRKP